MSNVSFHHCVDENEKALFDLLLQCVSWQEDRKRLHLIESIGDGKLLQSLVILSVLKIKFFLLEPSRTSGDTILRVAGGWVRDKV